MAFKSSRIKKTGIVLIVVLLVAASMVFAALWNGKPYSTSAEENSGLFEKVQKVALLGGSVEITEGDINQTVEKLFEKEITKGGLAIKGFYSQIKGDRISFYVPVRYKGINLLPNTTGKLTFENDSLIFRPSSFKVGKFPLPRGLVMGRLSGLSRDGVEITKESIEIERGMLPLNIKSVKVDDGKILLEVQKFLYQLEPAKPHVSEGDKPQSEEAEGEKTGETKDGDKKGTTGNKTTVKKAGTEEALAKISSQLSGVKGSIKSPKGRQLVGRIQAVVNAVKKNPNYKYKAEAEGVKAAYRKLPPEEKAEVKNALLKNVDLGILLRLINLFGV